MYDVIRLRKKFHIAVKHANKLCDVIESFIVVVKRRQCSPMTDHITVKYHNSRQYVDKAITFLVLDTKEQTANI